MKIGIVIPAHNEEQYLSACLQAVQKAIEQIKHHQVEVLVVLDQCNDQSLDIVQNNQIRWITCSYQCVGQARDLGIRHLIAQGATWIACTDADSCVDLDWLYAQIQHQPTDVICGVVQLDDFSHLSPNTQKKYLTHYKDRMNHQHIHGANLSFSAQVYLHVGGFEAISCHEDIGLVHKFIQYGYQITWTNRVRVSTSSRLDARAPEGLSYFLSRLENAEL